MKKWNVSQSLQLDQILKLKGTMPGNWFASGHLFVKGKKSKWKINIEITKKYNRITWLNLPRDHNGVQGYKNYYLTDKWWKVPEVVRSDNRFRKKNQSIPTSFHNFILLTKISNTINFHCPRYAWLS